MSAVSVDRGSELPPRPAWLKEGEAGFARINGFKMRYVKVGSGKPLVLLHTIRTQLDYFQKIIPELSGHFEVYAPDLPGHGHSDIPGAEYTEEFFTRSVEGFLEDLDINDATVVGESIGGVIVLSLGGKQNPRIKKIISLNPYDYGEGIKRSSAIANLVLTTVKWPIIGWVVAHAENKLVLRNIIGGGFHNPKALPKDLLEEFNRVGFRKGYRTAERSVFMNWKSWIDARAGYSKISAPVTLVYGENDWSREEERKANHELIKGSKLIVIKETGHFSSLENPEKVIGIILDSSYKG
jgi:pimeloyl-ACP methyl ester carboxylesterase